jgi:hypothetical protein
MQPLMPAGRRGVLLARSVLSIGLALPYTEGLAQWQVVVTSLAETVG